MRKAFDTVIRPRVKELEKSLRINHIPVNYIENDQNVTVMVKFRSHDGNMKYFRNGYIKDLKAMGLL